MRYPASFFFIHDEKLLGFHLKNQDYYEIESNDLKNIKAFDGYDVLDSGENIPPFESNFETKWGGDIPSHLAHQSSRIHSQNTQNLSKEEFVEDYMHVSQGAENIPQRIYPPFTQTIELPDPELEALEKKSLKDCFLKRKTCREYYQKPLELTPISHILYACFAPIHGTNNQELENLGVKDDLYRRSSPSCTGLASCQAILWVNRVSGLEKGLYAYDQENHKLLKLENTMTPQDLVYANLDQFWAENLSAGIFIVVDLRYTWTKDIQCRGYLSTYMEAGHISQNVLLTSTAFGLHTSMSGAFRDDILNEKLSLKSYQFTPLFIGLGYGSNASVSQEYLSILKQTE